MTRAAAIMRGYGVRIVWIVQNVTQLIEMYPRNWETFFANAGQVQVFGINDKAGAEYFSWRLGNRVKWRKRRAQGMRAEWEPAGASSLRDGSEVGRSSSRESGSADRSERRRRPVPVAADSLRQAVQARRIRARPVRAAAAIFGQPVVPETARGDVMKSNDKAAWRPRRFDVAGAHPDEAWRAVANVSEAAEEIRKQFIGTPDIEAVTTMFWQWQAEQALALRQCADAEVQRFLAKGVEIMDALKRRCRSV